MEGVTLRFLQTSPIRNPIDCAYSIGRNGLAPRMGLERSASHGNDTVWTRNWITAIQTAVERVLAEISCHQQRVGQATGARLCGLLKATSPRIYKDQLVALRGLLNRLLAQLDNEPASHPDLPQALLDRLVAIARC